MSKIILQNVRCSYVFITERRKNKDEAEGEGKYSIQILIKKNDPQMEKVKKALKAAIKDKYGEKAKLGSLKLPLRDGDDERDEKAYEGCYFLNANSSRKPGIVNRRNETADADDLEEYCFSGAYFHVSVNFYPFDFQGRKGIAVGLSNVMLRKKGDRLDGAAVATDEFADLADDDFDDDDDDF